MRGAVQTVLALLLAGALRAEPPKLPEPYKSIVELAHSTPGEFAADAMLRVVESGKIANRDSRRDLVEQAFRLASTAKFPVRMRALSSSPIDSRSGHLFKAYELKLDALSLESRAVRDMLSIDAGKARELFLAIARPSLIPLTCSDALVYDVSDFYAALGAVANGAFTAKEREKEEHLNFLLDYLGQATSPAELPLVARVIKTANVTADERQILWTKYNGLLEGMALDDRAFSATLSDLSRAIGPESQASFQKYMDRGFSNVRCEDSLVLTSNFPRKDKEAFKTEGKAEIETYWQSGTATLILESARKLRFGQSGAGKLLSDADRSTPEWLEQLTDFLKQLADWSPGQEKSEADYYNQKCIVYEALVELVPPGAERDKLLEAFVSFIGNSNLQQQSPVEWFTHAQSMLARVRNTNNGEPTKVLEAFQRSGNPVLSLYVTLESTFGSKLPDWVTLSK